MIVTVHQLISGQISQITLEQYFQNQSLKDLTWIHLESPDLESDQELLSEKLQLCENTLEDALAQHSRSGIEQHDGMIAFIVECALLCDGDVEYQLISFFLRDGLLVTLSNVSVPLIAQVHQDWINDPADFGDNVASLTAEILDSILDAYFPIVDHMHERIEDLEEEIFSGSRIDPSAALDIKRTLLILRKRLSPVRDTLNSIVKFAAPLIPTKTAPAYNDLYFHCIRLMETIDLGRDILSTVLDTQQTLVGNRLNEVMRTLTVISTLMMSSGLIAGIYGMNFKHMPELEWAYGYPFALGLMVAIGLGILAVFRRKKWL